MAGMQLAFGGLSAGNASQSVHQSFISDENKSVVAELKQQNAYLLSLLKKDNNLYLDGREVTSTVNKNNAKQKIINNLTRR